MQVNAAADALNKWNKASAETGNHKYLVNKNIQPHGIKTDGFNLLIPMYDAGGKLCSIQTINPNGEKRFLKDGRIKGCYYPIGKPNGALCLCEGFATGATTHEATGHAVAVCFNAGNLQDVAKLLILKLPDTKFIFCADDDHETQVNVGIKKAGEAAALVDGVIAVPDFGDSRNGNTDFNDMARLLGNDAVARAINEVKEKPAEEYKWPEITPLDTSLPPVEPFNYKLLPDGLALWVKDIVERTQCPPDFVAVTVMVALASLVGKKVAIHPKQYDDWLVTPNLWGALIGRPSAMKSPAMSEGLRPLKRLAKEAHKKFENDIEAYQVEKIFAKQQATLMETNIKTALKNGKKQEIDDARADAMKAINNEQEQPVQHRYIVNDATIEKLGELLNQNPNGLLLERDELTGWLKNLDKEDRANDRAFYLECFNGGGSYTYDRIGRGTLHIESATVSLIGGLQPSKLRPYVWQAINHGTGDDGLMQRFQLAVYPDDPNDWVNIDRCADTKLKNEAYEIFKRLDDMEAQPMDDEGRVIGVRFDDAGQQVFNDWREELESKTREQGIHPAIESHLTKYRSLMPSIALVINEVEQGHCQSVTGQSALKASAWCQYLESHAMRIYAGAIDPAAQGAELILGRRDKLSDGFTQRNVQRKGWAGLSEVDHVKSALNELIECGYLREVQSDKSTTGGRPSWTYFWSPLIESKS